MEIIQQLETILNEGATIAGAPFRFEVTNNLAYLDSTRYAEGLELIPVLAGSASGTYLPVSGLDIEQMTISLAVYAPVEHHADLNSVLGKVKDLVVGKYRQSIEGEFLITNMDAPLFAGSDLRAVGGITKEVIQYQVRFYYLKGQGVYTGNDLKLQLNGYELKTTSATISYSNNAQSVQLFNAPRALAVAGTSHMAVNCSAIFETGTILDQVIRPSATAQPTAYKLTAALGEISLLKNEPVIVQQYLLEANKGSLATISLTLVVGG